ncbi:chromate transporter [Clostridium autoethanogenum]|uniref:Chromate transporter n=1 Tax=Clostridium autoethanogenum DSM 10061 TaxID=1341692 RepID=A0ABN4BIV8_9CLOT|nr:chromate transporter [Clostridium autoethanogenum]AGY75749.1 chromate transporter [Clostridium autoethanogenum DSM 10061]ALU35914.1 Chromate transporter [Clostridium autoethanogenum DSM 10061]OVY52027.1 Chromate transport protein [Clostridium autoethanogenum]
MIYWQLLLSFLQVGLFSFGGGYGILPLIQQQVVTQNHWLTMKEFADVVTISQMTPGPIALNASTFVGMKIAGVTGAIVATFGCAFPTTVLAIIVGYYYYKYRDITLVKGIFEGLRPAIVSLIATVGMSMLFLSLFNAEVFTLSVFSHVDWKAVVMFLTCLFILRRWKTNPIYIMLGSGVVGIVVYLLMG